MVTNSPDGVYGDSATTVQTPVVKVGKSSVRGSKNNPMNKAKVMPLPNFKGTNLPNKDAPQKPSFTGFKEKILSKFKGLK